MTATTGTVPLRIALSPLRHQAGLLDGSVRVPGVELVPIVVPRYPDMFFRMGREQAYDVCELSVMSYYCARQYGLPFSAIPIVPRHQFHHRDFVVHRDAGITEPVDLVGRRVGTRSYTVTPGVQDRGILQDEFGISADQLQWVLADREHIEACEQHYPANVQPGRDGDLFPRMVSGEIPAGIAGSNARRQQSDQLVRLFPDHQRLDRQQYERTGVIPAFTVIVVHDRVLEGRPWLLEALYDGFARARSQGLEPDPGVADIVDGSPVPFGLTANAPALQQLLRYGHEQQILTQSPPLEELFAAFD